MKKKIIAILGCMCACLLVQGIPVMAAEQNDKEVVYAEQEVNLDEYMQDQTMPAVPTVIYGVKPTLERGRPSSPNADGGYFWVEWGAERHYSLFDHSYKVHRTSAGNSKTTVRGDWTAQGYRASTWCYSTLTGNTAYWATQ
ncbi:lactococcin 972 family bacteriocin [Faecalicatena contorta]|uniref:Bacteriocin, lactococcin 972 family n=1 Tax=Faecalicatena contorta TaxID=39482 RepID=A0A315ZSQ7_9FIRM|nr:lactococcin 972 family bacteriocin [Faecalicatena contorta]PWJ47970.1 lactococcin 972 family bacteriocin [Faecalicatena contorta]SUQ15733.1 bacteriocin, lactococcin 972 family [Faecalicatena contorta]